MSEAGISEALDAATRRWLDLLPDCLALAAVVLILWSILDLIRIRRDQWDDMELPVQTYESSSH